MSSTVSGHSQWWVCRRSLRRAGSEDAHDGTPLLITVSTAVRTAASSGRLPDRQLHGASGDVTDSRGDVGAGCFACRAGGLGGRLALGGDAGIDLAQALGALGLQRPARYLHPLVGLGLDRGQRRLVVGDLGTGTGASGVGLLVAAADEGVAGIHAALEARVQEEPHQEREDDERTSAPRQLLELGRDRVRALAALGFACFGVGRELAVLDVHLFVFALLFLGGGDELHLDLRSLGDDGCQHVSSFSGRTESNDIGWVAAIGQRPIRMNTTKPIRASASVKAMPRNIVVRTMPAASG